MQTRMRLNAPFPVIICLTSFNTHTYIMLQVYSMPQTTLNMLSLVSCPVYASRLDLCQGGFVLVAVVLDRGSSYWTWIIEQDHFSGMGYN